MEIYYLCNIATKEVLSIGPIPDAWKDVTGLSGCPYHIVSDLTWAGYPSFGFLKEGDALAAGINPEVIKVQKLKSTDVKWDEIRSDRDARIRDVRWRIERHNDQVAMGKTPSENVMPLLEYVQELRDVTAQKDPFKIVWPALPV
jgi:hypothetical protein